MSTYLAQAKVACQAGKASDVITAVEKVYRILGRRNGLSPFPAGLREADQLLEKIGSDLWDSRVTQCSAEPALSGNLLIASSLFTTGGHTATIKDLADNLSEPPVALWLTQPITTGAKKISDRAIRRTGLETIVRTFVGGSPLEKARQMIDALAELKPARVFLSHFSSDCAAVLVAAAALKMGSRVCLLHFADKNPTSGLFLSGIDIIDFTPRACAFTRDMLKLRSAFVPLTCPDPGVESPHFLSKVQLTTAVSGSLGKVKGMRGPDYPVLVAGLLQATSGYHVHIGPLSKKMLVAIRFILFRKKISCDRFKWIAQAPTLIQALREHHIDLVINTYPAGGARTAVEVMAAGLPMMWHSPTPELDNLFAQTRYPDAFIWRNQEELFSRLQSADRSWLEEQGGAARKFYEDNHHPRHWQAALVDLDSAYGRHLPEGFDASLFTRQILEYYLESHQVKNRFRQKFF